MPARRNPTPSYLLHKQSGRARAVWTDQNGTRQQKLLPGPFDSTESRTAFARLQMELAVSPAATSAGRNGMTVAEILAAYLNFAERYYLDRDGSPTKELSVLKYALKPVRDLYADTPAVEFGPLALKAVRQHMVGSDLSRALINRRIGAVKRVFKWAVSEELIPPGVYEALRTLPGLRHGRTAARETKPVGPVNDDTVDATLPHLPRHVRAMVELMRHTGMRPSEVCAMTLNQIDRTNEKWTYRPTRHKTAHHGKSRTVQVGPKAKEVLTAFLAGRDLKPDAPIFSPMVAREERFEAMRQKRKSKVQPSQHYRRKAKPKRKPAERYTAHAISHAVTAAVKKAGVAHWHPYQLRHTFATKVRKQHGLEAAQVLLGHSRADVTQVYAERNEELAANVATKIG